MDTALLIGLVIAITQVIKKWLPNVSPIIISVIVSIAVVTYKALEMGHLFNAALLGILITVIIGSNGAYKVVQRIAEKK